MSFPRRDAPTYRNPATRRSRRYKSFRSSERIWIVVLVVFAIAAPRTAGAYPRPGQVQLVSGAQLSPGIWAPGEASISADGRWVAFTSSDPSLVPEDTNGSEDVFVRNLKSGAVERVSVSSRGEQGRPSQSCANAEEPSISANGRFVAFASCYPNLVEGDANAGWDIFVRDLKRGITTRVSVSSNQVEGAPAHWQHFPSISASGRFVAFESEATTLVVGDTNLLRDVFVHDLKSRETTRVSISSAGDQGDVPLTSRVIQQGSNCPSISASGRFVSFASDFTNLVEPDTNNMSDVFLRDRERETTERVSVAPDGTESTSATRSGSGLCYSGERPGRAISDNGRFVAFFSGASNLVPADENQGVNSGRDVFVKDRRTRRIDRVSVTSAGEERPSFSADMSISGDGRYVGFMSYYNFFPEDSSYFFPSAPEAGDPDVFLYDRFSGALEWISRNVDGEEAKHCYLAPGTPEEASFSGGPTIGADGRLVAFHSCADNLTKTDTHTDVDAFVRDRGPGVGVGWGGRATGASGSHTTRRAIRVRDPRGDVALRRDSAEADVVETRLVARPSLDDVYLSLDVAQLRVVSSAAPLGAPSPLSYGFEFSVDGRRYLIFTSSTGGSPLLSRCVQGVCMGDVRRVAGSLGATGERAVFALPLRMIAAQRADQIVNVRGFVMAGDPRGQGVVLDDVALPDLRS